jgi:hypothetical protein
VLRPEIIIMTKLSDTALVILSAACQREGARVLPLTTKLKGGALSILLGSLNKRGLIEAIPAEAGDEVWAEQEGTPVTLRATAAAFEALGIEVPEEQAPQTSAPLTKRRARTASREPKAKSSGSGSPKRETKQALLIGMLRRSEGATVVEIAAVTGWLNHTIRGAISGGLKKRLGLDIKTQRVEGRGSVYRLVDG